MPARDSSIAARVRRSRARTRQAKKARRASAKGFARAPPLPAAPGAAPGAVPPRVPGGGVPGALPRPGVGARVLAAGLRCPVAGARVLLGAGRPRVVGRTAVDGREGLCELWIGTVPRVAGLGHGGLLLETDGPGGPRCGRAKARIRLTVAQLKGRRSRCAVLMW